MKMSAPMVLLFVAVLAMPFAADAGQYYSVVNVDASDTLNVRTGVEAGGTLKDTTIIGALPPDATGVEATGVTVDFQDRLWREIRFKGSSGWVAARFLRSEGLPDVPDNLRCSGTEPFWGLSLEGETAVFKTPERESALPVISVRRSVNRLDVWGLQLQGEDKSRISGILVYTDQCSDAMSDFNYAFEFYVMGIRKDSGPLQGCCTFG